MITRRVETNIMKDHYLSYISLDYAHDSISITVLIIELISIPYPVEHRIYCSWPLYTSYRTACT